MRKLFKRASNLSTRLLTYFLVIILIMSAISFHSIASSRNLNKESNETLGNIQTLQLLLTSLEDSATISSNYFANPSQQYLSQFQNTCAKAITYSNSLRTLYPDKHLYRDIQVMIESYQDDSLTLFRAYNPEAASYLYLKDKLTLENIRNNVYTYIYEGMSKELEMVDIRIRQNSNWLNTSFTSIYVLVFFFTGLCFLLSFKITSSFVKPIVELSNKFRLVAHGDLTVNYTPPAGPEDEVYLLSTSFNKMVTKLQENQNRILEKQKIEVQLHNEKLKNIEMQNSLNRSELEYLLMQINPHFLYNTLNSISTMSMIEDAPQTKSMLDSLSGLLRSSLSVMSETITLATEVQTLTYYLLIQKVRFQSRLQYTLNIPEYCLEEHIPAMILQPLVENAIIHGLEDFPGQGHIAITAHYTKDILTLIVSDNGIGIPSELLEHLLSDTQTADGDERRSIGIYNVKKRLFLIYNKNVMDIESQLGKGTHIILRLPRQKTDNSP